MSAPTPARALRRWLRTDEQRVQELWRVLDLVGGQVRHAETKSVAALATAGLLGQVLLVLAGTLGNRAGTATSIAVGMTATGVVGAGGCAVWALWPRRGRGGGTATNPLFFGHLGGDHGFTPQSYQRTLIELTRDTGAIMAHLSAQIWENAAIARRKLLYANLALAFLLFATAGSAAVAALSTAAR
ncbi:Pycsar system effector family protein [Nocardia farcinica]|uniref:Pycsar system effector family protein n=1 Tax=Nocardia farcinica TaxID=37329 RepID=UPI001894E613|nr:Pycsar system effector family protein [Nocardia farcinica]MBF6522943.1 hypothetical protein [Nocardia farcinica]